MKAGNLTETLEMEVRKPIQKLEMKEKKPGNDKKETN